MYQNVENICMLLYNKFYISYDTGVEPWRTQEERTRLEWNRYCKSLCTGCHLHECHLRLNWVCMQGAHPSNIPHCIKTVKISVRWRCTMGWPDIFGECCFYNVCRNTFRIGYPLFFLYTLSSVTGSGHVKYMASSFFDFYMPCHLPCFVTVDRSNIWKINWGLLYKYCYNKLGNQF